VLGIAVGKPLGSVVGMGGIAGSVGTASAPPSAAPTAGAAPPSPFTATFGAPGVGDAPSGAAVSIGVVATVGAGVAAGAIAGATAAPESAASLLFRKSHPPKTRLRPPSNNGETREKIIANSVHDAPRRWSTIIVPLVFGAP